MHANIHKTPFRLYVNHLTRLVIVLNGSCGSFMPTGKLRAVCFVRCVKQCLLMIVQTILSGLSAWIVNGETLFYR